MANLAQFIDHTLLKPEATEAQVATLCQEAIQHSFATVCVRIPHLAQCAKLLKGSTVLPIAVVGFPSGNVSTEEKVQETKSAIALGAKEIDMVIAVKELQARHLPFVFSDMAAVVKAAGADIPVKVIIETCLLSTEEKIIACSLAIAAGAAFVKTSTGFSTGGATAEDVALMRSVVGKKVGVKASGGIRTRNDAEKMLAAGANRLGTSNGIAIVTANTKAANDY